MRVFNPVRAVPAAAALLFVSAGHAATCGDINQSLASNGEINSGSATIVPAAGNTPAYCLVNLQVPDAINIRVGLPLSSEDGGAGNVQGAWNGKVQNMGGGGYAGSVGNVTGAVASGYVGSSTDTGHSAAWCNQIDPATGQRNSLQNCGLFGGGFVLDANNTLVGSRVTDFIRRSLHEQVQWALTLSKQYYGTKVQRNYWNGCSTGGRQGFEMAQQYGHLFDGLLVGAPAMNWNRFIMGNLWAPIVTNALLGATGVSSAKTDAANAAAVAACDAQDGVVDGLINQPRRCNFDASVLMCTGSPSDPATCLTAVEADVINRIWDGPRNQSGERLWGGVTRGTSFGTNLPGGNNANGINLTYLQNWMHEDPTFDWRTVTQASYPTEFEGSHRKFRNTAATDDPNLDKVRKRGGKILHWHGLGDALIYPFTSEVYVSRVFDRYGVDGTQKFMRSFFFPGVGHCGGGDAPQPQALFDTLVNWVENGVAPDHLVAGQGSTQNHGPRTRKVCKYPDELILTGSNANEESSFSCVKVSSEPDDLRATTQTARDYFQSR